MKKKILSELFLLWILTLLGMLNGANASALLTEESRYLLLELTKVAPDRDSTLTAMYFTVTLKPDEPGYPMTMMNISSRIIYDLTERVPGKRYPASLEPIKPYFVSKDGRRMKFKMLADRAELGDKYYKYNPIAHVTMQYRRCFTDTAGYEVCEVKAMAMYLLTNRDWVLDGLEHLPGHAVTEGEIVASKLSESSSNAIDIAVGKFVIEKMENDFLFYALYVHPDYQREDSNATFTIATNEDPPRMIDDHILNKGESKIEGSFYIRDSIYIETCSFGRYPDSRIVRGSSLKASPQISWCFSRVIDLTEWQ